MSDLGEFPVLGWSHSRQQDLEHCERRYYWRTYGAWKGWEAPADDPAWLPYRLKHLLTPRQHVGMLVHECARDVTLRAAKGEALPDSDQLFERSWAKLQELRTHTREQFGRQPKRTPMLWQLYYDLADELPSEYDRARSELEDCLVNLTESDVLDEVAECGPDRMLSCDAVDAVRFAISPTDSVLLWAAPDIAYWSRDGQTVTLVDWKTGSTRDADLQLATYAIYVRQRYRIPFAEGRFRGRVVALGGRGTDAEYSLTRAALLHAAERIRNGVTTMRSLQADARTNEPVAMYLYNLPDPQQRAQCGYCCFAELCRPELHPETDDACQAAADGTGVALCR